MSRTRSQDRFVAGARIGNYRIGRELGSSPAYATYEAAHVVLPRLAIVKVMHARVATLQPFAVQMLREACILEALRHAGVPAVYESGLLADKRPWLALERVDGDPLIARLADGLLAPIEVAAIVRDVASVLAHAHRRGVIHGSLKPEQIMLTAGHRDFPVCVVDWSDARPHDAIAPMPHIPMPGSRTFVAPELARGDQVDDRADVYALGVIAYQAMTGALPYDGAIYISANERCPHAPRELCTVIDQMLALDRFDRPSSAEVRDELAWPVESRVETDRDVPIEDIELPEPASLPRIRKPRWTPAVVSGDFVPGGDEATLPERLPE
jgi:eukaryotic-like serine/threonine-protein kinase